MVDLKVIPGTQYPLNKHMKTKLESHGKDATIRPKSSKGDFLSIY